MQPGEARIGDSSRIRTMLARRWSHRKPVSRGVISVLTLFFWAGWVYLVLPLLTAVLWFFGVQLFAEQMASDGYEGLRQSLLAYSTALLALVGLLAAWIAWNVVRYGGSSDRRTVKRAEVTDPEIWEYFRLDDSLLDPLRRERLLRVDVNASGCVVLLAAQKPSVVRVPPSAELEVVDSRTGAR